MRGKLTTGQTKHHSLFTEKRQATQIRPKTNLRKVIVAQNKQPASNLMNKQLADLQTNLQVGQQREKYHENTEAGENKFNQNTKKNKYNANTG